jgi:transaldolase
MQGMDSPNPLRALQRLGQSVWVDDIHRAWLTDGTLQQWIELDGISGVTSNPAIFGKSISGAEEYRAAIAALGAQGLSAAQICETLALQDVQAAADLLAPLHRATGGQDGYVSLEVSPLLADHTGNTLHEARRLWRTFDRPNAMIKVPATAAGLPAIRELLAEGINVNATLIFGLRRYGEVVDAFLGGLETRAARRLAVGGVASVASFFLSRIDRAVDARLDSLGTPDSRALRGKAATACARLAYAMFRDWSASARWRNLHAHGAMPQRLLWASTSTKDPAYDDLKYVEPLIGPDTVNTLPRATLDAYRDHGRPMPRLEEPTAEPRQQLQALQRLGIDMEEVAAGLERDGVRKFVEPYESLLAAIAGQLSAAHH